MNRKKDDRRVRKTKKALREGFIELMADKPVKNISVQELTDRVDIHRGTFYLHYSDIYDLQAQIENDIISEVQDLFHEALYQSGGEEIDPKPVLEKILVYIAENERICKMLLGNVGNNSFIDKLSTVLKDYCVHVVVEHTTSKADVEDVRYLSDFLVSGYISVITRWLERGMPESPQELAEKMSNMGLYGRNFLHHDHT